MFIVEKTSLAFLETSHILHIVPFKPQYITSWKQNQIPYVLFGNWTISFLLLCMLGTRLWNSQWIYQYTIHKECGFLPDYFWWLFNSPGITDVQKNQQNFIQRIVFLPILCLPLKSKAKTCLPYFPLHSKITHLVSNIRHCYFSL